MFEDAFPKPYGKAIFSPADLVPSDERLDNEYPFVLTTGRQLEHWHTGAMTRRDKVLDALEPEPFVAMNPLDMHALGLEDGEEVRARTRGGKVTALVRMDTRVPEGLVFMSLAYVEAAANILTNPKLDPYGKIPEFKFAAARVERLQGGISVGKKG